MAKETMETVAFRAKDRQCRWMNAEARRRKVDRSELLRRLLDEKMEEAKLKRERARQAVKMMRAAGDSNFAEVGRRLGVEPIGAESGAALAEKLGVNDGR